MELALRVLIAATLLSSVHARAAAVQENNPPSQAQAAAARDINALVRQVLIDRIPAKDIPGLVGDAKRIAIRSDRVRLPLGQDALPALQGYELRLISTEEAQAEAERTQTIIHFIAIERLQIQGNTASLSIGVDFTMPRDPKRVKMCCCSLVGVSPDRRPLGLRPVGRHHQHPNGDDVLVVCHGGVISAYLAHCLGLPLSSIWRLTLSNCSITELAPPRLLSMNVTAHLAEVAAPLSGFPTLSP